MQIKSRPFLPKHPRDEIAYVKVMLYVYKHPNGKVWFDNIVLEEVTPTGITQIADFENDNRSKKGWQNKKSTDEPER